MGIEPQERRALDAIEPAVLVETLRQVLAIPSISGSPEESEVQHSMAAYFDAAGLDVDLWPIDLDALRARPDHPGEEVDRTEAWGVVATTGGGDGPTLVLNGHSDVVPTGDRGQWRTAPFVPEVHQSIDGRGEAVFGRGACDMKGGLVCALAAVRAVRSAGLELHGTVALHSVVGEEDGGIGTWATLERGHRGDACVIPEPTRLDLVPACGGALTFRLRVRGRAAHASMRRSGVSAVDQLLVLLPALRRLEERRNLDVDPLMAGLDLAYPLSIGRVAAGEWASSVPDLLEAEGRIGVVLDEDVAAARASLEGAVEEACEADPWLREHPAEIEWFGGQFASGRTDVEHPIARRVAAAHADLRGSPADVRGGPYGSDLRLMNAADVPTVHYGPGSARWAHAPNEHVPIRELVATAEALVLTILRTLPHG